MESFFSPGGRLRKRMLSLSTQQPSQPNSFLGVILTACCESRSKDHNAGTGPSQSLRLDSSLISMPRSRRFPFGETSIRPSPLMSPFGIILRSEEHTSELQSLTN